MEEKKTETGDYRVVLRRGRNKPDGLIFVMTFQSESAFKTWKENPIEQDSEVLNRNAFDVLAQDVSEGEAQRLAGQANALDPQKIAQLRALLQSFPKSGLH